jgi:hypothetical protein
VNIGFLSVIKTLVSRFPPLFKTVNPPGGNMLIYAFLKPFKNGYLWFLKPYFSTFLNRGNPLIPAFFMQKTT